jgi:1-deoxy-D-xylulose-5-phosphate reductoisomerase
MAVKRLTILGSTGSIGVTTLDLVARFPERFAIEALAGGRNVARLADQVRRFRPSVVATADEAGARELRERLPDFGGEIIPGAEGLECVATVAGADLLVSALVGALGLGPTLAAIGAGKDVALANKEVLVVAGELVWEAARVAGVRLFPLDSEHNAIYQALHGHRREDVRRLVLTASGGPFLDTALDVLERVTPEQALRHPTWKMGNKITIDSSTLMNKGLEVIEARWFFDLPPQRIDVVVHPQSIVHSMVEYIDGSVIAQLGIPDMSIPISFILGYPERLPLDHLPSLDLVKAGRLDFAEPDFERFPCLALAYRALGDGGSATAVLNAANEIVVDAFLGGSIAYLDIPRIITSVLDRHTVRHRPGLNDLLRADAWARSEARSLCGLEPEPARVAAGH